ncbi:hypothetical protein BKA66DRAFT_469547 [Pyrenochaeta sp. MPI-SDFR-AT-0127]|nr:hypothetical protein BKA66DRAFT_469547 [Pyrenochaeta sp. MPI-SDFR-AT-0127]
MATTGPSPDNYIDDDLDDAADEQPINLMAEDCKQLFDECLARSVDSHVHPLPLQILHAINEYHHRFDGWCKFLGVFANEFTALDYRLRRHAALQDMIIRMLDLLRQNLFLVTIHDLPSANEVANHVSPSTINEVLTGIKEAIIRLNKIGIVIRSSSRSTITARARRFASQYPDLIRVPEFEDRAFLALHYLYPNAPRTLRHQLLDSMTDRYARLRYEAYRTEANNASGMSAPNIQSVVKSNSKENAPDKATDNQVPDSTKEDSSKGQKMQQKAPIVIPTSSIDTTRLPPNLDQAVAPSIRQSDAPKTLTGYDGRLREPDLPKFKEGENHTSCEWCHQVIDRSILHASQNEWSDEGRRHYRRDLQPYMCLSEDCREARPSFASSGEWFLHMRSKHTDSWSLKVHNQLSWICTAKHENASIYAFSSKEELLNHIYVHQCKTWVCTGRHEEDSTHAFNSRDELLRHILDYKCKGKNDLGGVSPENSECLALSQSMRKASVCPLCLFSMEKRPLVNRVATNDAGDQDIVTSWAKGSHIANHLYSLMTVCLQIMATMQASQDEGEGEGNIQSQSSGPSTAFSGLDEEVMKKRLDDLPASIQGSMGWYDAHDEVTSMPGSQEELLPIHYSKAYTLSKSRYQEQWDEAEVLRVQVMEAFKEKLGVDHPDTLTRIANLASLYRDLERWEEAEELEVQVLEISKKKLGVDHQDTLTSMANLALVLKEQGKCDEAESLYRQTLAQRAQALGPEHPETLGSMANLALVLDSQGKYQEAESLYLQTLARRDKLLGPQHPDTLTSMTNLASSYKKQGRLDEAEDLDALVKETFMMTQGVAHPHTPTNMTNMALVLDMQGKCEEEESINRQIMAQKEKVHGLERPDTLISASSFDSVLKSQVSKVRWK